MQEDLREQTHTSATAVVAAPGFTMAPAAPAMQLSAEASAFVAAINGALAPRLDGIQGPMRMLVGK